MKTTEVRDVLVEGTAPTKQRAVSMALNNIQKQMSQSDQSLIIRIEPIDVEVKEAKFDEWEDKFLFFFAPQKKTKYYVLLLVKVQVTMLSVDKIPFQKERLSNNKK